MRRLTLMIAALVWVGGCTEMQSELPVDAAGSTVDRGECGQAFDRSLAGCVDVARMAGEAACGDQPGRLPTGRVRPEEMTAGECLAGWLDELAPRCAREAFLEATECFRQKSEKGICE